MNHNSNFAAVAGAESLRRVIRTIDAAGGQIGPLASALLDRHGYRIEDDGVGPHGNVLGHPLFELPLWLATRKDRQIDDEALLDICESSLCGYLSVRAEDDYFDAGEGEAPATMMLSSYFRTRHQSLLASRVSSPGFWFRFELVWSEYYEAMLLERSLHDLRNDYGPAEFDAVLARSQPLELPALAVLALQGLWDAQPRLSQLVRHLVRATQIFDDYVDAPEDLGSGNFTYMVRRLGGADGPPALLAGMVAAGDAVVAEASADLDRAARLGLDLGMDQLQPWIDQRKGAMRAALDVMYTALFSAADDDH